MGLELVVEADGYRFDFSFLEGVDARRIVLEAPQGFVRLLPRLVERLRRRFGVEVVYRLEPSYGLCSVSLAALEALGPGTVLVHLGHDFYPYPLCWRGRCRHGLPSGVYVVVGEYLGGDAEALAEAAVEALGRGASVALGYSVQHRGLARRLVGELERRGVRVVYSGPVLGCYYARLLRLRGRVGAFLVLAGGVFHSLGLGLALGGGERVLRLDPYTGRAEDIGGVVARVLAKRYWAMTRLMEARSVAVIAGLLPGQNRPGIVEALTRLLEKRGMEYDIVYAERLTRELLDNLNPGSYDAYIVTSCPRLAIDDLGDYWKPVLTPGEALVVLREGRPTRYIFPW